MKRISSILGVHLFGLLLFAVLIASCKKDEDTVKPSAASPCSIIKARYNSVSIELADCSSWSGGTSNPVFNEHGQMKSFDFNVSCGGSSYAGKVSNIAYDSAGDVSSYDATVNGQTCHWQKP